MKQVNSLLAKLVVLVFGLIYGCSNSFEPSGSHHVDLAQPDSISATINLSMPGSSGSPVIEENTYFTFQIGVEEVTLYENRVYLDSILLHTGYSHSGSFYVNPNLVADGLHNLKLELVTSTGSGSLAEKLGAEAYLVYGEWPLYTMGNEPLHLPAITSIYPDDGRLRINWSASQRIKFEAYQLNAFGLLYSTETVGDTSFLDPYYIGGEIVYQPLVRIAGRVFEGNTYTTALPLPRIHSADKIDASTILLKWSPCAYPANFGRYSLELPYRNPVLIDVLNDTTYLYENVPFGKVLDCRLSTTNNSEANAYNGLTSSIPLYVGDSTGLSFKAAGYNPATDRLILHSGNSLKIIDGNSLELLETGPFNPEQQCAISPQAQSIVGYNNAGITSYDPSSLAAGQSLSFADLLWGSVDIHALVVSETGIAHFVARISNGNSADYIVAIDLNSGELIGSMLFPVTVYSPKAMRCSANGEYVVFNYTLMRLNNGSYSSLHQGDYASYMAFESDPQRILISTPTWIKELELPAMTEIRSVSSPSRGVLSLNTEAGYLGAFYPEDLRYIVFDVNQLGVVKDFPALEAGYVLFQNLILSSQGYAKSVVE